MVAGIGYFWPFDLPYCPHAALDPLGHHAVTCRHGGDVVVRHNRLLDVLADSFRRAHLSVAVEKGHGLKRDRNHQHPADLLVTEVDLQLWTSQ